MSRWVLLALSLALAAAPRAQAARVTGTVTDAETGAPLPGAHVFVSGTSVGDAADARGRFEIAVDPGPARLTATMLGYGTAQTDRLLRDGDAVSVAFRLPPDELALAEVEVVGSRDPAWARALARFRPVFLGVTPNAERTALANPGVLDLAYEPGRSLEAVARAPLVVRNDALGYEVTFYDLHLTAARADWAWIATVSYRDLCDERACGERVAADRARAYRGSPDHFLRALVQGRLGDAGFEARRVGGPGRHGGSLFGAVGKLLGLGGGDDGVEVRPTPFGWEVETGGALRVEYGRERDGRDGEDGPQVSWLVADDGVLRLSRDGALLEPDDVVRYGYWDWERAADAVPRDYRPAPPPGG